MIDTFVRGALVAVFVFASSVATAQTPSPASPNSVMQVNVGASIPMTLPGRARTVVVSKPETADAKPIAPDEIMVIGKSPGTTDVYVHLENGTSVARTVKVVLDRSELQSRVRSLFGSALTVEDVGDTVAVRGVHADVGQAELLTKYMDGTGLKWLDMTRVAGLQQVQLRVRIAEASRSAIRELSFGGVMGGSDAFGGIQSPGGSPFQPVSISPQAGASAANPNFAFDSAGSPVSSATTLFAGVPGANLEAYLQALSENRYVRLLAEPNLVAVSGEEATFLVGGEFPVPVVQGALNSGGSTVTIQYKEFGVRLNFRPHVLGEGRIRLEVAPEVSELSEIGAVKQNGFTIPSVITRRSKTTIELGSGQSFAMAGLLRSKDQTRGSRVPVLGDLPILGTLFRSVRYEQDHTELVVMVTADLVEPIDNAMDRPVPGDLHTAPDDWELFMEGSLSGRLDIGSPKVRLKGLGLDGLTGPGAWKRSDAPRVAAADAQPESRPASNDSAR